MRINNLKKGFTTVELLIYSTILALIIVVTTAIVLNFSGIFKEIRAQREIDSNLSTVVERIVRDVRGAQDVDVPNSTFVTYPGNLTLLVSDGAGGQDSYEYYLENGVIKLDRDGVYIGDLTGDEVTITDFKFFNIDTGNSEAVRVVVTGEIDGRDDIVTKTFYGAAVLRNTN